MHDIIRAETEANRVSEAMARMRQLVLSKGPLLMRTGQHSAGISIEMLTAEQKAELALRLQDRSYTYPQAAREYGIDVRTVFEIARCAGIRRNRKLTPEQKTAGLARIRRGHSIASVARYYRVSPTVFQRLRRK